MKIDLQNAEAIQKMAENRAERWIKAWGNYGEYAHSVTIDWKYKQIRFGYRHADGIAFSNSIVIDLSYLENDSTLEKDSIERKRKEDAIRQGKFNRINELKQTKEVMELVQLERELNPHHYLNHIFG